MTSRVKSNQRQDLHRESGKTTLQAVPIVAGWARIIKAMRVFELIRAYTAASGASK